MRVAILSLSLKPESWVARDSSVARVFVEYSLLDLPSVETTWPLPKPPRDESVSFNYSKGQSRVWGGYLTGTDGASVTETT